MDILYIKKVLKGDIEAYGYLIRQHQKMAFQTAMSILKNEADAEDIVQDSFIQGFESLSKFRGDAKFSSWICRIVINKSLKFYSTNKRINTNVSEGLDIHPIEYNEGIQALDKKDLQDLLKKGLSLLSAKEALTIQLFYMEEQTIDEIQYLTGFSKSNIKVLLHRGRKNLYMHLSSTYDKMK